jgi:predicted DNA binding CopG/RHH family protein
MKKQIYKQASDEQLAEEARQWDSGLVNTKGWVDAPEAIPRIKESTQISLRLPTNMLEILKEFAKRKNIGYQVLLKEWLDDRIKLERNRLAERVAEPHFQFNSGNCTVRLPETLRKKLSEQAGKEGVGFNEFVESVLSASVSQNTKSIDRLITEVHELRESLKAYNPSRGSSNK